MVILDASFLVLFIEPGANPPLDPTTKKPVDKCKERIEYLIANLALEKTPVVVPAPSLSEFLVGAGRAAAAYLDELHDNRSIRVEAFGERAAVECARLIDGAKRPRRRKLKPAETWAKLKFDRQILAIAKTINATAIYTNDTNLAVLAARNGVMAIAVHELPLPPVEPQMPLGLSEVKET